MKSKSQTRSTRASVVVTALALAACSAMGGDADVGSSSAALSPSLPPSSATANADPAAWVVQVVPALLGRPVRSFGELKFLSVAVARYGQRAVVDALMLDPAFVDRWTGVMLDRLQVPREDDRAHAADSRNMEDCYGQPLLTTDAAQMTAAQIVLRTQRVGTALPDPDGAPPASPGTYDMADVVRGALLLDNVFPIYRGHLFSLVTHRYDREDREQEIIGAKFNQTYLNKSAVCMQCHNTSGSCSPGWFSAPKYDAWPSGHEEKIGFTFSPDGPIDPSWTSPFQTPATGTGAPPFAGWSSSCGGVFGDTSRVITGGTLPLFTPGADVWQLDAQLKTGYLAVNDAVARGNMNAGTGHAQEGRALGANWLAVAFTNDIWREVFGDSLTIANFGYRLPDPLRAAWTYSEQTVMANRWSLRALLRDLVTSQYFNRYVDAVPRVPDFFEPFLHEPGGFGGDPGTWAHTSDFAGDAVHRRSADLLFRMKASALAWRTDDNRHPWVSHFPSSTSPANPGYPNRDEALAMSLYLSSDHTSGKPPIMSQIGMLGWEASAGRCDKPAHIAFDWIDGLVGRATAAGSTVSLRDAIEALKYRLVGRGITHDVPSGGGGLSDEELALQAFLGGRALTSLFTSAPDAQITLRNVCSVIVKSPQFMLEGVSPEGETVDFASPPSLLLGDVHPADPAHGVVAGLDDDTPQNACGAWAGAFNQILPSTRRPIDCSVVEFPPRIDWSRICGPRLGRCLYYDDRRFHLPPCLACGIVSRWRIDPPPDFDPRVEFTIPPDEPARTAMLMLWTEAATVSFLSGKAQIVRASTKKIESPVLAGAELAVGDAIELWPGAQLKLMAADGTAFETPPGGMPDTKDGDTWLVLAMGQKSLPPPSTYMSKPIDAKTALASVRKMRDAQRSDEPGSTSFVHQVTAPSGNTSVLDDPVLNGNPNAVVLASRVSGAATDNHAVGVYYTGTRWAIYNEDGAAMPAGAAFAVRAMNASGSAFLHKTTASNVSSHITYIDDSPQNGLAGLPYAAIQITHVWNAPGLSGVYDNHPTSVYYDGSRWAIYHDDFAAMPVGTAFAVKYGGELAVTSSAATRVGNVLVVDDPTLNGMPLANVLVTHNWNPPGAGGTYTTKYATVRYDGTLGKWTIANLDATMVADGVSYNVHRGY